MDTEKPVFIIGAPRSGSTYLDCLLSSHPDILITNETRVMIYASRMLSNVNDIWCIYEHKSEFEKIIIQHTRDLVIDFYRRVNTKNARIWGDKFPNYANDSQDPRCLENIDRLFPQSKFIHLVRDPRAAIQSLVDQRWNFDYTAATETWKILVGNSINWGRLIKDRFIQVRYEDLILNTEPTVESLLKFLEVPSRKKVYDWIEANKITPFSTPASEMSDTLNSWRKRIPWLEQQFIEQKVGDLMQILDYH